MSALVSQEIQLPDPIANFVSNFIQTESVQNNINAAVGRVVGDIQLTWNIRNSNSILDPFDRNFKLDNPSVHDGDGSRLNMVLSINNLANLYWTQCNLHRDKEHRPCKYRLFLKASYLEISKILNERVQDHFTRHEEVRVTPSRRITGFLAPQNTCYHPAVRVARYVCMVIPIFGWMLILPMAPTNVSIIPGNHTGKIKMNYSVTAVRG